MVDLSSHYSTINRLVPYFDQYSTIWQYTAEELTERLPGILGESAKIVDSGCRTGFLSQLVLKGWPNSTVIGVDESEAMISLAERRLNNDRFSTRVSNLDQMPIEANSIDLIISNHSLSGYSPESFFTECKRLLKPKGAMLFSMLGVSTFGELTKSALKVENFHIDFNFPDMHNIGDLLLAADFMNPVVDIDKVAFSFQDIDSLLRNVECASTYCVFAPQMRMDQIDSIQTTLEQGYLEDFELNGKLLLSVESVYGVCWKKSEVPDTINVDFDFKY